MSKFYLTTTLPYVNADPHIGFALEIIQADVIARYHRMIGDEVVFNFGADEHGLKIYRKAQEAGIDPQKYCDIYAAKFDNLKGALNLSTTNFIRTTDPHHIAAAQEFWKLCDKNGDIYKKLYKIKYCVGCELEKTDSELVDDKCPLHPNLELEVYEEENYFFRFSKYQKPLLDFYKKTPQFVVPENKFTEIKNFVEKGLEDFSISRLKAKMPWGIDVPGDEKHVMYVWFDALINYVSTIGWPTDKKHFNAFWPVTQFAGKDNLRQQSAIWQAMLMAARIPNSRQIFIHGFMTVDGQKISKSLGNVINPLEIVDEYGADALRYYLLAKVHPWEDSDFSMEKFKESYNADLANNVGNLVSRVAKLCESAHYVQTANGKESTHMMEIEKYSRAISEYAFNDALTFIWNKIDDVNHFIDKEKPWELVKSENRSVHSVLSHCVDELQEIAALLQPFLPNTSDAIQAQFSGPEIVFNKPLFPRIS